MPHLSAQELDVLFDLANYTGEASAFVDRVLASHARVSPQRKLEEQA